MACFRPVFALKTGGKRPLSKYRIVEKRFMPKKRREIAGDLIVSSTGGINRRGSWGAGYQRVDGYNTIYVQGEPEYLHRRIWIEFRGPIEAGSVIHHKNLNANDQRLSNLAKLSRGKHAALHARIRKKNHAT